MKVTHKVDFEITIVLNRKEAKMLEEILGRANDYDSLGSCELHEKVAKALEDGS